MSAGLRIGVVGATGLLGRELIDVLDAERLDVSELRAYAGDRSLGEDVEFRGDVLPVASGVDELTGLDVLVLCTPSHAALDLIRLALRVEVPCVDCSGALVGSPEVPLAIAALGAHDDLAAAPLISSPPGPALVWAPVLAAIQREAGLRRVVGTVLQSASSAGRAGVESLSEQTLALLNQRPLPNDLDDDGPRAFDCHGPAAYGPESTTDDAHPGGSEDGEKQGASSGEAQLARVLGRLIGRDVGIAATSVHVPTFAGQAVSLAVETERPISPDQAATVLGQTPGLDVHREGPTPGTRDAVGREEVIVGRLRADATAEPGHGLLMWLTADPVRLAATNAVKLVRARFPSH